MTVKPLHVRVAEALGWIGVVKIPEGYAGFRTAGDGPALVPNFPTDWAATGPLIDRLGIMAHGDTGEAAHKDIREPYDFETEGPRWFKGRTTLESVCWVILALKEAGRL